MRFSSFSVMVELTEYALAFMASTLLVTGSVVIYNSFTSYESGLQLRGALAAVAGVAESALQNGSARSMLPLPASTIGCERGTLYVSVGSGSISQGIDAGCDFRVTIGAGTHLVSFNVQSGQLDLAVS
jgi:hypothetical protein